MICLRPADLRLGAFSECILSECLITTLYPPMQVIDGKAPAAVWWHAIAQKGMSRKSRPGAFEAVDLAAAKDLTWANGAMHARIGFEGATQKASLGILIASNDAPVPAHTHDGSWEMLAALKASGTMKRADQPGSTDLASSSLVDGAVVAMPKGTLHAWEPDKTKPLVAVQLYVPAGPEQRFKKLAEDAAKPSGP